MNEKIKVGITVGDTAGIGPEVVAGALSDSRMWEMFVPVVYAPAAALEPFRGEHGDGFQFVRVDSVGEARIKRVNLIECSGALEALERAVEDKKKGLVDVIVTGPINKETIGFAEGEGPGHTEFFAAKFGGQPLMMMCGERLRVGLATVHLPLEKVSSVVSKGLIIDRLTQLRQALVQDFGIVEPRIAVLALNPHAGDGGLLGVQEGDIIAPAIKESGVLAFGPFAADGFFAAGSYVKYDAVLAMYHDQGLIPFKSLAPEGVNFTAGLPVVRTSPDHGVAYDIAGKGVADCTSMREAIYLAMDVFRRRSFYAEITRNPLQHFEREKGHKDLSVKDLIPDAE